MAHESREQEGLGPQSVLTSHQVGALLHVNPTSVNNWIRDGRLQAHRTPGGHRRIKASDLVAFLRGHGMPVPPPLLGTAEHRLLWVDDEPALLRSLQRAFRAFPHVEPRFVDNGVEALVLVGSFHPAAIVLDIQMPQMDGLEVCRRLRAAESTRDIDIVIVSGCADPYVVAAAEESGIKRYLFKPVRVATVIEAIGWAKAPLADQPVARAV